MLTHPQRCRAGVVGEGGHGGAGVIAERTILVGAVGGEPVQRGLRRGGDVAESDGQVGRGVGHTVEHDTARVLGKPRRVVGGGGRTLAVGQDVEPRDAESGPQLVQVAGGAPTVVRGLGVLQVEGALLTGRPGRVEDRVHGGRGIVPQQGLPLLGRNALDGLGGPRPPAVDADQRERPQDLLGQRVGQPHRVPGPRLTPEAVQHHQRHGAVADLGESESGEAQPR